MSESGREPLRFDRPASYQIKVQGQIQPNWAGSLGGMTIRLSKEINVPRVTTLEGVLSDQAALAGVLNTLYELHLPVLSVVCRSASPASEEAKAARVNPITKKTFPIEKGRRNPMTYGAIDFLALEFKTDQLKGEIMPELLELVKNKIVRVIDLVMIQKYEDGHHEALEMQQLAPDLLELFNPLQVEISGIIQAEDIANVAEAMEKGSNAALLLFENLWAVKFAEAVRRANGRMLAHDRIPFEVVNEALETFAKAESEA